MVLQPFDFDALYDIVRTRSSNDSLNFTNPYSNPSVYTLTYEGCINNAGTGTVWYSRQDVYDRVLLWRVPLVALWATATLPAFGLHTHIFTLIHLVGDPIDTFWSLFYKLDLAKRNARWARDTDEDDDLYPSFTFSVNTFAPRARMRRDSLAGIQTDLGNQVQRAALLKEKLKDRDPDILQYYQDVIALIIAAYDEWDLGIAASKAINYGFHSERWTDIQRAELRDRCASAAFYISSDRVSRILPSAVSTLAFFIQISAGFWKTLNVLGDSYEETNPTSRGLNRAPHNIAFSALYFWLPPAVLMTAFVGGSQTSHLVPRVLERLRSGVQRSRGDQDSDVVLNPQFEIVDFPNLDNISNQRWLHGGLPVWQSAKFRKVQKRSAPTRKQGSDIQEKQPSRLRGLLIALTIVTIPTGCAIAVSWLTPTQGFGCRGITQLSFFIGWILSVSIDWLIFVIFSGDKDEGNTSTKADRLQLRKVDDFARLRKIYWITFAKDLVMTVGSILMLTFTALGIFNNCNCWSNWSVFSTSRTRYLSFPQEQYIFDKLVHELKHTYPIHVCFALLSQIIIFIGIAIYFSEGWRVLRQRDLDAALKGPSWIVRMWRTCRGYLVPTRHRSLRFKRVSTFAEANTHRQPAMVETPSSKTRLVTETAVE